MPSGPKKRRAQRKKNDTNETSGNPAEEKQTAAVELSKGVSIVSEMGVLDSITEAVSEMGLKNSKLKEFQSVDQTSALVVDKVGRNEDVSFLDPVRSEGKQSEIIQDDNPTSIKYEGNDPGRSDYVALLDPEKEPQIIAEAPVIDLTSKTHVATIDVWVPFESETVDDQVIMKGPSVDPGSDGNNVETSVLLIDGSFKTPGNDVGTKDVSVFDSNVSDGKGSESDSIGGQVSVIDHDPISTGNGKSDFHEPPEMVNPVGNCEVQVVLGHLPSATVNESSSGEEENPEVVVGKSHVDEIGRLKTLLEEGSELVGQLKMFLEEAKCLLVQLSSDNII